jgi:hypothetical protein
MLGRRLDTANGAAETHLKLDPLRDLTREILGDADRGCCRFCDWLLSDAQLKLGHTPAFETPALKDVWRPVRRSPWLPSAKPGQTE